MITDLINKILITMFFLAFLNVLRHGYYFIQSVLSSNEENPNKYKLQTKPLLFLGVSIAYVLTVIFTGIMI